MHHQLPNSSPNKSSINCNTNKQKEPVTSEGALSRDTNPAWIQQQKLNTLSKLLFSSYALYLEYFEQWRTK